MSKWFKAWLLAVGSLMLATSYTSADDDPIRISNLPPAEQYRQLSLVVLMAAGASSELVEAITPDAAPDGARAGAGFNPDDYRTPLFRIVDQESMLAGAAYLLRYAQISARDIQTRLSDIKTATGSDQHGRCKCHHGRCNHHPQCDCRLDCLLEPA